jgi:glycosyltransferase involved in cell wall biosynthesis
MVNILIVSPLFYPYIGGIEVHVKEIAKILSKNAYQVDILTTDPSGKLKKIEKLGKINVIRFSSNFNNIYNFSYGLYEFLQKESAKYDLIHTHNYSSFPALASAISKKNVPIIFTPHYFGMGSNPLNKILHIPYFILGYLIFRRADKIISINKEEYKILIKRYNIAPHKIKYTPNGVNYNYFRYSKPIIKDNKFRILYVGRLSYEKNIETLIKACGKLKDKCIDYELLLIGDGPLKKSLKVLAKNSGVDNIKFLGFVPYNKIAGYYKSSSIFVLPSSSECSPLTILEAMAAGLPILVSKEISDKFFLTNLNAYKKVYEKFDTYNQYDLEKKILNFYEENFTLNELGQKFAKKYDWSNTANKLLDLYNNLIMR